MTIVQCPRCQFRVGCWFSATELLEGPLEPKVLGESPSQHRKVEDASSKKFCSFFEPDRYVLAGGPIE